MRKFLVFTSIPVALFTFSCQQKPAEQPAQQQQAEQKPAQEPKPEQKPQAEQKPAETLQATQVAQVKDMQTLAQQKGCFACHDINTKKVGPAFKEVAKRFAGQPNIEEELAKRIKNGGV
ncbi:MAG: cytochrome C, partial [Aquificaceae bacterium]|nr:cytochrome C [Aquificaceae bacterium]